MTLSWIKTQRTRRQTSITLIEMLQAEYLKLFRKFRSFYE